MSLLERSRMFVHQKPKLIELTNEYAILGEDGEQIGFIRQEGQSKARKVLRFVSSLDQYLTHTYAMYDADGTKVLELTRPRKLLKSRFLVSDGAGLPVGTVVQENVVGRKRFRLLGQSGEELGSFQAENLISWDFQILDPARVPVGRVTKKWKGLGIEALTTADNYMVEIDDSVEGPFRMLAVASAASIDTALKQDAQGFN
ncbi:MAG TPA: phospholipid scramblase-related protein [Actinomycetota bacterium]